MDKPVKEFYYRDYKVIIDNYAKGKRRGFVWTINQPDGELLDISEDAFDTIETASETAKGFIDGWIDNE